MINRNPFSVNRTEYMNNLWRYYVPFKDFNDDVGKPVVVIGGRGTGKSMYFLCNSWRERVAKLKASSSMPMQDFLAQKMIGIYYKVDSTFVGAMNTLLNDNIVWQGYFNTYLSVSLFLELLPLINMLYDNSIIDQNAIRSIINIYFSKVRARDVVHDDLNIVKNDCCDVLQEIEDQINGTLVEAKFRPTQPGTVLKAIIDVLHSTNSLAEIVFKIYIDEYESLSEFQQKIINTLIKQSGRLLIYNISTRHNGMKTRLTLAENEILQAIHDYQPINFDDLLNEKEYEKCLKEICQKRFELFFAEHDFKEKNNSTDIEFYLSDYDSSYEIKRFNGRKFRFKIYLETVIRKQSDQQSVSDKAVAVLCTNAPALNARLHLALLLRTEQYRPTVSELLNTYTEWTKGIKNKHTKKYDDWLHNAKNGLIFLLAKDCSITKLYYGFDTFTKLSSGVVRYFLELCEQAFNLATIEGFTWDDPKPIPPEIQTRAAKYVSQYKVNEIASYPICGKRLRIFTQYLGEIYRDLHRNTNTTLGEPEVNHFTTETLSLNQAVTTYLKEAITWLILQELPQTKDKEPIRSNVSDYHLNKIYTPYFEISYNKKRKIKLDLAQLEQLFSGNTESAKRATKAFLIKYWNNKNKIEQVLDERNITEIDLFEADGDDC